MIRTYIWGAKMYCSAMLIDCVGALIVTLISVLFHRNLIFNNPKLQK